VPELPDVTVYIDALHRRIEGEVLEAIRLKSPFLVRSFDPPIAAAEGKRVVGLERIGKRIVLALEGGLFLVLHLMIAGRLRWRERGFKLGGKTALAGFDFADGTLLLTEASHKKRASLFLVRGRAALADFDRGGLEVMGSKLAAFRAAMTRKNHTLKRAMTDPRILSGVGNAYSDEILHRAKLSPFKQTSKLDEVEWKALHAATIGVLAEWIDRLRADVGEGFPEKVTAFRPEMAVHGRYGEPCRVCETPVQRIQYASNECNYCPECQTGGKLLADRVLSRLLKDDWPKTIEELEERLRDSKGI